MQKAEERKRKHPNQDTINQVKHCQSIYNSLDVFFQNITDVNVLTFARLQGENYRPILNFIGIEDPDLLQQVLEIDKLEDKEEKELALGRFLRNHPDNKYGLFSKAYLAYEKTEIKKARVYYLDLLQRHPQYAQAHYNLALLLKNQFSEYQQAREHYQQALAINPQLAQAHYNLAILLEVNLKEYEDAKKHFEEAIRLNPALRDLNPDWKPKLSNL